MTKYEKNWLAKGYVDEPIPEGIDLVAEIRSMCAAKNAVILAHYYTDAAVQDIADFVGDSLALAQKAAATDADIIVMCGVHFMGETNKILCPDKKVLVLDLGAGCSLADSCDADDLQRFMADHPSHKVVSYVNTTAAVKALSDVVVTSSNAQKVIESFGKDEKIIFGPDKNLGQYICSVTGREMLLWNGGCHVHARFSLEGILQLKRLHPAAKILAHPECPTPIQRVADVVASTAGLLRYAKESNAGEFIVATESGILHKMREECPDKTFIPAPPELTEAVGCSCNECAFMKLNSLPKLYNTLKYEWPTIEISPAIIEKAAKPIQRMLELSKESSSQVER
ncbi:MAG: quinolinate synthase NadA [Bacteroidaceae bacterium]|nr:quinolinate synthase NadA [Bacteroidaceae bacterium]